MNAHLRPIFALSELTKQFGTQKAVNAVTLEVSPGEIVGFVGVNGAGKTTTISMLLGFLRPSSGKIQLFGEELTPANAHIAHRRIGYATGDMALFENLTGRHYIEFVTRQHKGTHQPRLHALCKRFEPQLDKKIGTLSRGNRQKIALIAAFVTDPELIILDEPTSGLDPLMQHAFLRLVREEAEKGTTIFMSSHYLNEVSDVCSRVVLMREGKVVRDIDAKELKAHEGKIVKVTTGLKPTLPRGAHHTAQRAHDSKIQTTFTFDGKPSELQPWIAGLKQLHNIEITDFDLETAFQSLYQERSVKENK